MDLYWQELEEDYYDCGEINEEAIIALENELQLELPALYSELLLQKNGFSLKYTYCPTDVPNSWANNFVSINGLYGVGEGPGLRDNFYLRKEWGIRSKKLVIIAGEAPIFICLDYRKRKQPIVTFIDAEMDQQFTLTKSFDLFLNSLEPFIEEVELEEQPFGLAQQEELIKEIDVTIEKGSPAQINRLLDKVLGTTNECIRHLLEKMRRHEKPKVHFYLMMVLTCCSSGENEGMLEDDYLLEVLHELMDSKNRDVRDLVAYCFEEMKKRGIE